MVNNIASAAEEFFSSDGMSAKKDSIKRAADSPYGKNVKNMLEKSGFEQAVRQGNMEALKSSISSVLKTEDGERLMRELSKIMENKREENIPLFLLYKITVIIIFYYGSS